MRAPHALRDVTNTVEIGDAQAVAATIDPILTQRFGAGSFDRELLFTAFADADRLFAGSYPGYLACDMPYHDLRHSLDTALVMARMIDGYQIEHGKGAEALDADHALLGVLLALLHDTGFIRRSDEAQLTGPQLMPTHEDRGIGFAERYLEGTSLAAYAPLAFLIDATRLMADLNTLFDRRAGRAIAIGRMLGTADLVAQISDRYYIERCYFHLYPEFVLSGCNFVRFADGSERPLYDDGLDLLRKTPAFFDRIIKRRLEEDFRRAHRYLALHFGGTDPYTHAMVKNIARLTRVVATGRYDLLRREPLTTTEELDPIYRARPLADNA